MRRPSVLKISALCVGAFLGSGSTLAGQAFRVHMETAPLAGHVAGPFTLSLQLTDGSGLGDANKTIIVSNFTFSPGGGPIGAPSLTGAASGDMSTQVTLRDQLFVNEFTQTFQPGATFDFDVWMSTGTNPNDAPDCFSIALLDSTRAEIPTMGLVIVGSDPVFTSDLDDFMTTLQLFGGDAIRSPVAGGAAIALSAPSIQPLSSSLKGDVNGDGVVDISDAQAALRIFGGLKTFGSTANADTWPLPYGDGQVDVRDIVTILRGLPSG